MGHSPFFMESAAIALSPTQGDIYREKTTVRVGGGHGHISGVFLRNRRRLQVGSPQGCGSFRLYLRGDNDLGSVEQRRLQFIARASAWVYRHASKRMDQSHFCNCRGLIVQEPGPQTDQCASDRSSAHAAGVLDCFLLSKPAAWLCLLSLDGRDAFGALLQLIFRPDS